MSTQHTPAAALPLAPLRGFAAILLLAALLAGAATVLGDVPTIAAIAVGLLTAAVWIAGVRFLSGKQPGLFWWIVLLAALILGAFLWLAPATSPRSPHTLHVTALLAYGAVAVAAMLAPVRRVGEGRALLLACSLAIALFTADLFVPPPKVFRGPEWHLQSVEDPHLEIRYVPNSTGVIVYPDNPRGYFKQTPGTVRDTWSLMLQNGNVAQLEHVPGDGMHITISKVTGNGSQPWNVELQQTGFSVTRGSSYKLTFHARADAARRISCELALGHEPWTLLGEFHDVDLQPEWKDAECSFVATSSEPDARLLFNLASSTTPIEMRDVVLHNLTTGRDETPALPPVHYVVDYRFNSLGFRGPDYAVPRPPDTFRIVALGDSYTLGVGVHEPDTFEVLLQNHLNREEASRAGKTNYEVINTGVSGYATRQELWSYKLFSSTYQPQLVLLVMVFNDDLSINEETNRGFFPPRDDPGGLVDLWDRSQMATRVRDYSESMRALKELDREVEQRGSRLAVVIFQNAPSPDAIWDPLTAAVKTTLAGTDTPILNLQDGLFVNGRDWKRYWVHEIDGHPNELAHRIAAEQIERWLRNEHLLPEDRS